VIELVVVVVVVDDTSGVDSEAVVGVAVVELVLVVVVQASKIEAGVPLVQELVLEVLDVPEIFEM